MKRYPFPSFPRSWYRVAPSSALGARGVLPLHACGQDLVLWRGSSGTVHALDAHCPHQGAHLGYGGVVAGEAVRCPFHGWVLGPDGGVLRVPGCPAPPRAEPLRSWPIVDQDGDLFLFHDPGGRPPGWSPPPLPEASDPTFVRVEDRTWRFRSHVQEVIENLVDAAHFTSLHRTPVRPRITFSSDGDHARLTSELALSSMSGPVETAVATEGAGLGIWVLRFSGLSSATVVTHATPLDGDHVEFRLLFLAKDAEAGRAFARSVVLQVEQDERVWEHKIYRADPPLSDMDGPILPYRRWAERFYPSSTAAGGADGSE